MSELQESKKVDIKTKCKNLAKSIKNFIWPANPSKKAERTNLYKNVGLFAASTFIFVKYGAKLADWIYNPALIEEQSRLQMQGL